jgi:hypothetical protein
LALQVEPQQQVQIEKNPPVEKTRGSMSAQSGKEENVSKSVDNNQPLKRNPISNFEINVNDFFPVRTLTAVRA